MSEKSNLVRLDLAAVFKDKVVTVDIGGQKVSILPLGAKDLSIIVSDINKLWSKLKDDGVTEENYEEPENIMRIAELLLSQFPGVLERATKISAEDIGMLPIDSVVDLLVAAINVNLQSIPAIEKSVGNIMEKITPGKKKKIRKKL